jgi:hypothetical protein
MRKRKIIVTLIAAIAALVVTSSALADHDLGKRDRLRFEGAGAHSWNMRGGDSPHDQNARALRVRVGDPSLGEYVAAYSRASLNIASDAEAVMNLSLEYRTDRHLGAGAPRISVEFQNGDVAYLSAFYCNHPLAVTGGVWGRADFTRFHNGCAFYVLGETSNGGLPYEADGARSAWEVYTDAHPDQIVERTYFVADETGGYRIDRLSLGAGVMYQARFGRGKSCPTEASC